MNSIPEPNKQPPLPLRTWHYTLVMIFLYFLWGGFFTELNWMNQGVFNFAVFYPIGFMNGYFQQAQEAFMAFRTAIVFNIVTYGVVIAAGERVPLPLAGFDFFTLFLFIFLGIRMGLQARE